MVKPFNLYEDNFVKYQSYNTKNIINYKDKNFEFFAVDYFDFYNDKNFDCHGNLLDNKKNFNTIENFMMPGDEDLANQIPFPDIFPGVTNKNLGYFYKLVHDTAKNVDGTFPNLGDQSIYSKFISQAEQHLIVDRFGDTYGVNGRRFTKGFDEFANLLKGRDAESYKFFGRIKDKSELGIKDGTKDALDDLLSIENNEDQGRNLSNLYIKINNAVKNIDEELLQFLYQPENAGRFPGLIKQVKTIRQGLGLAQRQMQIYKRFIPENNDPENPGFKDNFESFNDYHELGELDRSVSGIQLNRIPENLNEEQQAEQKNNSNEFPDEFPSNENRNIVDIMRDEIERERLKPANPRLPSDVRQGIENMEDSEFRPNGQQVYHPNSDPLQSPLKRTAANDRAPPSPYNSSNAPDNLSGSSDTSASSYEYSNHRIPLPDQNRPLNDGAGQPSEDLPSEQAGIPSPSHNSPNAPPQDPASPKPAVKPVEPSETSITPELSPKRAEELRKSLQNSAEKLDRSDPPPYSPRQNESSSSSESAKSPQDSNSPLSKPRELTPDDEAKRAREDGLDEKRAEVDSENTQKIGDDIAKNKDNIPPPEPEPAPAPAPEPDPPEPPSPQPPEPSPEPEPSGGSDAPLLPEAEGEELLENPWELFMENPAGMIAGVLLTAAIAVFGVIFGVTASEKAKEHRIALAKEDFNSACDCIGINNYADVNFGTYCKKWLSSSVYFIKKIHRSDDSEFYISNSGHGTIQLVNDSIDRENKIFELIQVTTTIDINNLNQIRRTNTDAVVKSNYYAFRNPYDHTKYLNVTGETVNEGSIIETTVVDDNERIGYNSIFFLELHTGSYYKISIRDKFSKIKYYLAPKSGLVEDSEIFLTTVDDDTILWNLELTSADIVKSDYGWCFIKDPENCEYSFYRDQQGKIIDDNIIPAVDSNGLLRKAKKCDACSCRSNCIDDDTRWGALNRHWCPVRIDESTDQWKTCSFISKNFNTIGFDKDNISPEVNNWRFCGRDIEMTHYNDKYYQKISNDERTRFLTMMNAYDKLPNEFKSEEGIRSKKTFMNIYKIGLSLNYQFYKNRMLPDIREYVLKYKYFKSKSLCDLDRSAFIDGLYFFRDPRKPSYYLNSFSINESDEKNSVHMSIFDGTPQFYYIRKIQKIDNEYYYNIVDATDRKIISLDNDDIKLSSNKFTSWRLYFENHKEDSSIPYTTCITKIIKYKLIGDDAEDSYLSRDPNYESMEKTNLEISTEVGDNNDWELIKLM